MAKKKAKSRKQITKKKKTRFVKKSNKKITKSKSAKNKTAADEELIIKVSKHWAKKAYANKNSYQKKI